MRCGAFDGEPVTATFWWAERLCGGASGADERGQRGARRGSSLESYSLSAALGLAVLGLAWALLAPVAGFWACLLLVPVAFAGLHLLLFAWVLTGELLQRLGLLAARRRVAFHGAGIGASIAVAGIVAGAPAVFPLLAFILLEIVAWPARWIWQITGEGEG